MPDCTKCDALCCRHVAMEIDTPTTKMEYDNIRWYLMHEGINVFIDDEDKWNLEFDAKCKRLGPDRRCTDYSDRPRICRDYPAPDATCVNESPEPPHKFDFHDTKEFEAYLNERSIDWRFRRIKP